MTSAVETIAEAVQSNTHRQFTPGGVCSAEDVMAILRVSALTLSRWELAGLAPLKPATRQKFYNSDDVIRVMQKPANEIPEYVPKYKQHLKIME